MAERSVLAEVGVSPPTIRARVFVEDPLTARQNAALGLFELEIPGEVYLGAGPVSSRLLVAGEDTDDVPFVPVQVRPGGDGFDVGRGRPDRNFKFHRVNCWALLANVLHRLEDGKLLGRRIPWAFPGGRLRVNPHAGNERNAYYDRETGTLEFFYFDDHEGRRVYTCLSHDTVTHELGHAVLDGLKPLYWGFPSPQEAGFHEYFGDAIGMLSALTFEPVLTELARGAETELGSDNVVAKIGREVGLALFGRCDYTRLADNDTTMADLDSVWSEHKHSEVLTGAFYDILQAKYASELARRTAKRSRKVLPLKERVEVLRGAARRTARMLLRAIDYCPPVGLEFIDYARAVLRSDAVAHPLDERGYRKIVAGVFKARGIARSARGLEPPRRIFNADLRPHRLDVLSSSPTDAFGFLDQNRELLDIPRDANFWVTNVYRTNKVSTGGYFPPREIVIEFVWEVRVPRAPEEAPPMYCGGTMVFDGSGNVLHYVLKGDSPRRRKRWLAYRSYLAEEGGCEEAAFVGRTRRGCMQPADG